MKRGIAIALSLFAVDAKADSEFDAQVRKSYLTLSAFECAVIAPDDGETKRLFTLGLDAGRDFIRHINALPVEKRKLLGAKVAVLWSGIHGPTEDFILGQIYANRVEDVYDQYVRDDEHWKLLKSNRYVEKNCALLGR